MASWITVLSASKWAVKGDMGIVSLIIAYMNPAFWIVTNRSNISTIDTMGGVQQHQFQIT